MKNKLLFSWFALGAFLLFSCSANDDKASGEGDQVSLRFTPVFTMPASDLSLKQQEGNDCRDVKAAFADVVISQNGETIVGTMDKPLRIPINPATGDDERPVTEESSSLFLEPGKWTLEYFRILDSEGEIIWMSPLQSGEQKGLTNTKGQPIPLEFELQEGEEQFVDVEVECSSDSDKDNPNSMLSALETTEVIEFCIFGTFCDENGRHQQSVEYSVSAWTFSGDPENPKGKDLYLDEPNFLKGTENGNDQEAASRPLCIKLPDTDGEDVYYIEISMGEIIRSGVVKDSQIRELFVEENQIEYYHFREGNCNLRDSPDWF